MARLAILKDVLRDLSIRSKNKCAFPQCDHPILDTKGNYIAELCHIEAAESGEPRFNPEHTDEERRAYKNLLFLCHRHHKETDDELLFPVAKLQKIKVKHEALPEVIFKHEILLEKIEFVRQEQIKLIEKIEKSKELKTATGIPFPINVTGIEDAWTPEDGRFYEIKNKDGLYYKFISRDGWMHIEQTLSDGAIAYYEVNEAGSVRNSKMPYPINEYRVEIPESIILSKEFIKPTLGTRAILTTLKWSIGTVIEHFQGDIFVGADCNARCTINHKTKTISVLKPKTI